VLFGLLFATTPLHVVRYRANVRWNLPPINAQGADQLSYHDNVSSPCQYTYEPNCKDVFLFCALCSSVQCLRMVSQPPRTSHSWLVSSTIWPHVCLTDNLNSTNIVYRNIIWSGPFRLGIISSLAAFEASAPPLWFRMALNNCPIVKRMPVSSMPYVETEVPRQRNSKPWILACLVVHVKLGPLSCYVDPGDVMRRHMSQKPTSEFRLRLLLSNVVTLHSAQDGIFLN